MDRVAKELGKKETGALPTMVTTREAIDEVGVRDREKSKRTLRTISTTEVRG